ncbi:hypothetical protein QE152_g25995 [Popillia japonica]|uniref:Uncharacterized protein n=1 Tax=Popillia japonica TaxID=7064 RepID=A0AAW1JZS4_POPJA
MASPFCSCYTCYKPLCVLNVRNFLSHSLTSICRYACDKSITENLVPPAIAANKSSMVGFSAKGTGLCLMNVGLALFFTSNLA